MAWIEKPVCDVLGSPLPFDAGDGVLSADAIADPPPFAKARSAVLYDDIARSIVHRFKYKDRTDLAEMMARWMMRAGAEITADADVIVPVPLHRGRLLSRQFNQSAELARAVARQTGLSYLPATLLRIRATRRQVGLGASARADNVRRAFSIPPKRRRDVNGKSVLLVDDVYTTGATVKSAARELTRAGADRVFVLTFARVAPGYL